MENYGACSQCGRTTWYEEDGHIVCSGGHILCDAPAVANEGDLIGRGGRVARRKRDKQGEKILKVFHGAKAYRLFLQAWQFVLWKQCYALVHGMGLPRALWVVVRDLWAVRVARLVRSSRFEGEGGDWGLAGTRVDRRGGPDEMDVDGDMDADTGKEENQGHWKTARKADDSPALIDVAALNYLGVLILRYPLELQTLFRWLEAETVPFIRAIRHVPKDIRDRLPGEYHRALDTNALLEPQDLQLAVSRMTTMYQTTLGVTIPPLNHQPFLLSYIDALALPLQVYQAVKHLNTILDFSFAYTSSSTSRRRLMAHPETQLMSLVVVATKLLFPFDSATIKRFPRSLNDPGALRMDWDAWLSAKRAFDTSVSMTATGPLSNPPTPKLALKDTDILDMPDHQLDEYMDWYQRTWTNPERKEQGLAKKILDLFPVDNIHDPTVQDVAATEKQNAAKLKSFREDRANAVQASLKARRAVSDKEERAKIEDGELEKELLRPGMMYRVFRGVDELQGPAQVFYEEAAGLVGLTVGDLIRGVRSVEERVEKWRRERRRGEIFGTGEGGGDGGGAGEEKGEVEVEMGRENDVELAD